MYSRTWWVAGYPLFNCKYANRKPLSCAQFLMKRLVMEIISRVLLNTELSVTKQGIIV